MRISPAVLFAALAALGCCGGEPTLTDMAAQPAGAPPDAIEATSPAAPNYQSFQSVRVRVIDSTSSEAIRYASVRVVCIGGTLHAENRDMTDARGFATVVSRTGAYAVADIEADQYEPWMGTIRIDDAVVRLERSRE